MIVEEHVEIARIFLDESDTLFGEGDVLQGSEKVWGAAAHAMMAVAQQRGWPYDSHGSLKHAARRLSEEFADPSIGDRFAVAEKFGINSYYHDMEDFQIEGDQPRVRALVERLLTLYIGNGR
jgi:hypothetical protein